MELLKPVSPPNHDRIRRPISRFPSPEGFQAGFGLTVVSQLPDIAEEGTSNSSGEKVYVAVGKSMDKAASLLHWVFRSFIGREVCLLHVHQPSTLIPTLLGKLPASQANAEVLTAHRKEEKEQTRKLLESYLNICHRAKVEVSMVTTECDQVQKGIVELVTNHSVRKLVMGAVPENCMKVKKSSSKANYAAKNAPLFCEILFVNKGKRIWTREACEESNAQPPTGHAEETSSEILRSKSMQYCKNKLPSHAERLRSKSTTLLSTSQNTDWVQNELNLAEHPVSDSDSKMEGKLLCRQYAELRIEAEKSSKAAHEELLRHQKFELEAMEAINKVKNFEAAHAQEFRLRREVEDALTNTIQEQEKLLKERDETTGQLERTIRNVAFLDNRAQEANRRHNETAGELKCIQASLASLRQEKQRIRRQQMEAVHWLDRWRSRRQAGFSSCSGFFGVADELPELAEFSLSDVQNATCNFSESFKLGQGGYGCVYKGEMLGRTVAIKKLHPHNMQRQSEFHKEVQVLGKLQHPHLVTLLGSCPEAWSLVYEYLPNGSLQDRLFCKSNTSPLTWKIRARMIAEISSALCFLHSCKPEKIVHGDLKPQNILLDSELSCKICEFGICRLVTEDTLYSPRFRRNTEPKGACPYTDPEFHRIGVLTPKSDIYSFGMIILQLLTGKPPVSLVGEVRRIMSCGKLASILDPSAGGWPIFVARQLVDLGLQFCELNSRDRPNLTPAVVRELEKLHVSEERPVPHFFLCPILKEIMHDPLVAADGFTYEGEALRAWLENGRETSPMTNLKLSHLHLTPNHAIRLAIQDWLCKF
uniref:RING-type E3 ubiquitin transferase n=1 Tax=Rhizophora mucronata TaxID=61149 RepID=A0A2P2LV02_RHIMU